MKIKADRDRNFVDFLGGQMEEISGLRFKRMFGGYGIYADAVFFGIVHHGCLYFKTDAETRGRYQAHGMPVFQVGEKQKLGNYYQVPVEIIEDAGTLQAWALESIRISANTDRISSGERES
jgi:DNA transformation protein